MFLLQGGLERMSMDSKAVVAANVSALLKQRGWTQEELERRSGVAQKTVSNIVRTGSTMTGKLAAIAEAFGLEPWMMLIPNVIEIQFPRKLDAMVRSYLECPREGQEHIEHSVEKEIAYQRVKKI